MKMSVYWGCKIPTSQYAYEMSVRQVLPHFNIELENLEKTSCCGGPVRSVKTDASLYLSARNLALAYKTGIKDLLVPCNECHFMLSETKHRMKQDPAMNKHISKFLKEEELSYLEEDGLTEDEWETIFQLLEEKLGKQPNLVVLFELEQVGEVGIGEAANFGSQLFDILQNLINFTSEKISEIGDKIYEIGEKIKECLVDKEGWSVANQTR